MIPAAVLQVVFHSIIVNTVEGAAVFQDSFLDTVHMDADGQAHLGLHICKRSRQNRCPTEAHRHTIDTMWSTQNEERKCNVYTFKHLSLGGQNLTLKTEVVETKLTNLAHLSTPTVFLHNHIIFSDLV